jgi:hypothetical protein
MSDEINEMVGDLISQLQQNNTEARTVSKIKEPLLKENLEDFVIQKSSLLVDGTIDMVETVKDYITSAPESKDVASLAELINAATNAVETLNKIVLSNKKNNTIVKIKEMDIESKKELQQTDNETKLKLTREEMFKLLINNKPIEAEVIETKQLEN